MVNTMHGQMDGKFLTQDFVEDDTKKSHRISGFTVSAVYRWPIGNIPTAAAATAVTVAV